MNAVFFTQTSSLDMFYELALAMQKEGYLDKIGFYVTDSRYYDKFIKLHPEISHYPVLKEWEIIRRSEKSGFDILKLKGYEKEFGDPWLWGTITADRRLGYGPRCMLHQKYNRYFSDERLLSILQLSIEEINDFYNKIDPDFILSFICVTSGEYIGNLIAQKRKIKFLNLRPTRIRNYIYTVDTVYEPSQRILKTYRSFFRKAKDKAVLNEAEDFIRRFKKQETLYEGVFVPDKKSLVQKLTTVALMIPKACLSAVKSIAFDLSLFCGKYKGDNHLDSLINTMVFKKIIKPFRIKMIRVALRSKYIRESELPTSEYAFYPLHTEPEVTLLVYNRFYLNQIEVIRALAQSLPVGMKLYVKEHPVSLGKRPLSYYEKILNIPNVALLDPGIKSRICIQHARLVPVLGGTVGFEALLLEKPVIVLGNVVYEVLASSMLKKIKDITTLPVMIRDLLKNYKYNEKILLDYVYYIIKNSAGIDLYSTMLKKKNAYSESDKSLFKGNIDKLARYIKNKLHDKYLFP